MDREEKEEKNLLKENKSLEKVYDISVCEFINESL